MSQTYQLATLNSRLIAFGYDLVMLVVVLFLVSIPVEYFHIEQDGLVFYPIYFLLLWWIDRMNDGQSFGKKSLNIKVVDSETLSKPTFGQLLGRNILRLFFLIDVLFIFGKNRQRLGDRFSKTIVISCS